MKDSKIEWTDHTFNPWWGCSRVSPGCDHCYAEKLAKCYGHAIWGPGTKRRFFSDKHWDAPLQWNAQAEQDQVRRRVFSASMSDVFEDRRDLDVHRTRLWPLIESTKWLDWLLLTKRVQNVMRMVPWGQTWPANVWIGTTVENQAWADQRIPTLLTIPASVRFLSCEPLLGPIDLTAYMANRPVYLPYPIDWLIAGGESGGHARPINPDWVRPLRDSCVSAGVPFLFKQWGEYAPVESLTKPRATHQVMTGTDGQILMQRLGKKQAGRELDGRTWDELPIPAEVV